MLKLVREEISRGAKIQKNRNAQISVELVDKTILVGYESAPSAVADQGHGAGARFCDRSTIWELNERLHDYGFVAQRHYPGYGVRNLCVRRGYRGQEGGHGYAD